MECDDCFKQILDDIEKDLIFNCEDNEVMIKVIKNYFNDLREMNRINRR